MLSRELRHHRSLAETPWQPRPAEFKLPPGDVVHVWRIDLKQMEGPEPYSSWLSLEERARAERFHFHKDRLTYIYCRGILRSLLGQYLGIPPANIDFHYTEYGKPYLPGKHNLHFNLSHADGYALIAFTTAAPIGVDLEATDRDIDTNKLVHRFFSPIEISTIAKLPPPERPTAFFKLWTRKEALIKADGAGLSLPLVQFGITVTTQEEVRVLHTDWAPDEAALWRVYSFTAAEGLPGAIALKASVREVSFFVYDAAVS